MISTETVVFYFGAAVCGVLCAWITGSRWVRKSQFPNPALIGFTLGVIVTVILVILRIAIT